MHRKRERVENEEKLLITIVSHDLANYRAYRLDMTASHAYQAELGEEKWTEAPYRWAKQRDSPCTGSRPTFRSRQAQMGFLDHKGKFEREIKV